MVPGRVGNSGDKKGPQIYINIVISSRLSLDPQGLGCHFNQLFHLVMLLTNTLPVHNKGLVSHDSIVDDLVFITMTWNDKIFPFLVYIFLAIVLASEDTHLYTDISGREI